MPNWCNNNVKITGSKQGLSVIKKKLDSISVDGKRDMSILFETLVGRSEDITQQEYENGGWYEHNISRYGTKWDVSYEDASPSFDEDEINMSFCTAWSPPIEFIVLLSKKYKVQVTMSYSEPGVDFAGIFTSYDDGTYEDEQYSYIEGLYLIDKEGFWSSIEYEIEYAKESGTDAKEFVSKFDYVSDEDKKAIIDMFEFV